MIVVENCVKRAGVFVGARTYMLVYKTGGIYLLEVGKAMGTRSKGGLISDKVLNSIEKNRSTKNAERMEALLEQDLDAVVDGKRNFFIHKSDIDQFTLLNKEQAQPRVQIKSKLKSVTLHISEANSEKVEKICEYLK